MFPFHFLFSITYSIEANRLSVRYGVKNTGGEPMFFSVGGHPAFRVPLVPELAYEDYYLLFNKVENARRWPISGAGLIGQPPEPMLNDTDRLQLTKQLFNKDALVFKDLASDAVQLRSDAHPAGLKFMFTGFPYLGIWAAKNADFVCIEPWCGIADGINTDQDFTRKEGIIELAPAGEFSRTWAVEVW